MLTEIKEIDQITVTNENIILVREKTTILRDGEAVASSYHRLSFEPGSDVSGADSKVQAVASSVWG